LKDHAVATLLSGDCDKLSIQCCCYTTLLDATNLARVRRFARSEKDRYAPQLVRQRVQHREKASRRDGSRTLSGGFSGSAVLSFGKRVGSRRHRCE
ncbi:hypothetical protein ACIRRA_46015, partial [Nocardia sp. NPDC101769]|uniref:hypothetical protein n=1 Tax=Nocardia sp. NPDC101769 TaxID=3364333 RepID=UPI003806CF83